MSWLQFVFCAFCMILMTVVKPWDMIWVFFYLLLFALAATYDWVSGNCTNISLSWGLTYFANDNIILSMSTTLRRTDDLELMLRYWNFVSYSVCFLCSKLKGQSRSNWYLRPICWYMRPNLIIVYWATCHAQVTGFPNYCYKIFSTKAEAVASFLGFRGCKDEKVFMKPPS